MVQSTREDEAKAVMAVVSSELSSAASSGHRRSFPCSLSLTGEAHLSVAVRAQGGIWSRPHVLGHADGLGRPSDQFRFLFLFFLYSFHRFSCYIVNSISQAI
jgi:hypothetical protein